MTQEKNKKERFADYINAMNFSEVIEFFTFMMEDMMQTENHAIFDYHDQGDAAWLLNTLGVEQFIKGLTNPTEEERAYLFSPANNKDGFCNPWTEILDSYADWIISHVEDCMDGTKDKYSIQMKYPELFDVVRSKQKFKFVVEVIVEDYDAESARMRLENLSDQLDIPNDGLQITHIYRQIG